MDATSDPTADIVMDATSDPTADILIDIDNLATNDLTEDVNYNPNAMEFEYIPSDVELEYLSPLSNQKTGLQLFEKEFRNKLCRCRGKNSNFKSGRKDYKFEL
jgi:hypothetical protein